MTTRVLYVFGCAAPPVFDLPRVVEEAKQDGWTVCVGLTPTAGRWLAGSLDGLAASTGFPVRSEYKSPGEPDVWPPADVILVAPATFNTVNAWALGLTGTFVAGVAAEAIGKRIPLVAMPCANAAYVEHPQFAVSVETLVGAGVDVLYGEGGFTPNQPGERRPFPWRAALDAVNAAASTSD